MWHIFKSFYNFPSGFTFFLGLFFFRIFNQTDNIFHCFPACSHLRRLPQDHHSGDLVASNQVQPSCCSALPQRLCRSVRTHVLAHNLGRSASVWPCASCNPFVVSAVQAPPSDTVTWRGGGWSPTFTTAPRRRLWSSTSLYVPGLRDSWQRNIVGANSHLLTLENWLFLHADELRQQSVLV